MVIQCQRHLLPSSTGSISSDSSFWSPLPLPPAAPHRGFSRHSELHHVLYPLLVSVIHNILFPLQGRGARGEGPGERGQGRGTRGEGPGERGQGRGTRGEGPGERGQIPQHIIVQYLERSGLFISTFNPSYTVVPFGGLIQSIGLIPIVLGEVGRRKDGWGEGKHSVFAIIPCTPQEPPHSQASTWA